MRPETEWEGIGFPLFARDKLKRLAAKLLSAKCRISSAGGETNDRKLSTIQPRESAHRPIVARLTQSASAQCRRHIYRSPDLLPARHDCHCRLRRRRLR